MVEMSILVDTYLMEGASLGAGKSRSSFSSNLQDAKEEKAVSVMAGRMALPKVPYPRTNYLDGRCSMR